MSVRVTAVLAVSALFLVSSISVASAQTNEDKGNTNVTVVDCSQVQNVVVSQGQYGDANATVSGDGTSSAEIAQELNISRNQVNECLGNGGGGEPTNPNPEPDPAPNAGDDPTEDEVISDSIPDNKLPDTGGVPMSSLASGVALLLVGVSLVGVTTVRRKR